MFSDQYLLPQYSISQETCRATWWMPLCLSCGPQSWGSPSRTADMLNDSYSRGFLTDEVDNGNMLPGSDSKSASPDVNPTLSPPAIKPISLFGNHSSDSLQTNKEETDILDGIWPGSHNATLLTHFVTCHFSGDWSAYLPFAHWADSKFLGHPSTSISIDEWLSLNSGREDDGRACSNSQGGNVVRNKLCNKTVVDVNSSPFTAGTGTPSAPQCVLLNKTLPGKSSSGHQDICSMFPLMRAPTINKKLSTQMMEAELSFQEAEECMHLDRVEALRAQFAAAAQMKAAANEKGISWSS